MPRNRPLTPREHFALGAELWDIQTHLKTLSMILDDAYGPGAARNVRAAWDNLHRARGQLDGRICAEQPDTGEAVDGVPLTKAYNGWTLGPEPSPGTLEAHAARMALWDQRIATSTEARQRLTERSDHVFDAGNPWLRPAKPAE